MNYGKCENCSKSLRGRRSDAVTCSPACAQALRRARARARPSVPVADPVSSGDDLNAMLARLRSVVNLLCDGRTTLLPGEARLVDAVCKVIGNEHLLERWAKTEVRVAQDQADLCHELISRALAEFGIDAADERVRGVLARHLREMLGKEPPPQRPDADRKILPPHEIPLPDPDKAGG